MFQPKARIAILLVFLVAAVSMVLAQGGNQGAISGTVTDPSGALVPGAEVRATNTATGATFKTNTSNEGFFEFAQLPVGTYDIEATRQGFSPLSAKGVKLTIGAKLNLNLELKVSASETTVVVTTDVPVVETERTKVSSTIDDRAVADLPTNGRNFIDFVLLTGGVNRDVRQGDLSFAGQRGTLNSLTVDGTDNNNTFFGQTLGRTGSGRAPYQFSQDAVQEFQVNTNGYSAEFGRAGGAVINVITKSGSNGFHGTGFEFFRDRALNANDPIYDLQLASAVAAGRPVPLKPGYHFNQFGGNVGGPIVKDRTFFFFDYDGQRNNTGNPILVTLPAPANAFQAAAVNYLASRTNSYNRTFNQDVYLGKIDHNFNSNHQLSGRYNAQRFKGQGQENSGATSAFEHTGASNVNTDTVSLQETATFTPNLLNVANFSYQRDNEPGLANSINPEATVRNAGQTLLTVGRNSFSPRETTIHRQQYGDTITWLHGHHAFKFGGDILHDGILNFFPGNFSGSYTFNSLDDFGRSLMGLPVTAAGNSLVEAYPGAGTTGATTHPNLLQYSAFVQDDWRITRGFTLNLGVRYDVETIAQPSVQNPAALALGFDTSKIPNDLNNVAPRLGFAWQPIAGRQFVVRGGYGIFYATTPAIMYGTAHSNNGINVQTLTFNASGATPLPASYPNVTCGAPTQNAGCPIPGGSTLPAPTIYVFNRNYVQPYVQQFNLGVEHQIGKDLSVSVGYLGVRGVHLQRTPDINEPVTEVPTVFTVAGTGQALTVNRLTGPRPLAGFGRIFEFESNANSTYHGLIFQVNKRFAHNFQAFTSYTWSHVIDDVPDATAVVPVTDDAKLVFDPNNIALDRSTGNDDVRHRLVFSGIWDLNYAQGIQNHALKTLAEGWQMAAIFNAQSGQPYSALVNADLNNDGNSRNERAPGFGRNTFTMPAIVTLDPRVTRTVRITEGVKLQFIGEAFNILNHQNITGVRNTLFAANTVTHVLTPQNLSTAGIAAFGLPSAANINGQGNVGRVIQLAAKISF
ncbi:MAG TPA: carboxypeptidase regulatory-like domain-containing protein [Candidatus Angelobacter sp.]|jgi:outer membrane receptor protein involved in Fe transport|nr:carboxypeptidase regulatory-like domain-containing protein [Candidatus Angelobacter sp.]